MTIKSTIDIAMGQVGDSASSAAGGSVMAQGPRDNYHGGAQQAHASGADNATATAAAVAANIRCEVKCYQKCGFILKLWIVCNVLSASDVCGPCLK